MTIELYNFLTDVFPILSTVVAIPVALVAITRWYKMAVLKAMIQDAFNKMKKDS